MDNKLIIVAGILAGGKTTFSQTLSMKLRIPCFNKDLIKVELGKNIEINNRDDSKRLSVTTFNVMMHIVENFMKARRALIIEGNFGYTNGEHIKQLLEKYNYKSLTCLFYGDIKILHNRFMDRDNSPERDKANRINGLLDEYSEFELAIKPFVEFNIGGKIIKIDTSDFAKVNFNEYIKEGYEFIQRT
jgi:deoxyadenosine/deoxycytidine kinase